MDECTTPPTGRFTTQANKLENIPKRECRTNTACNTSPCDDASSVSPFSSDSDIGTGDIVRRTDFPCYNSRPLSRISETESEQLFLEANVTLAAKTPNSTTCIKNDTPIRKPPGDRVYEEQEALSDSLCPRVLLAALEKAKADAIAKENEGTRTMSMEEINEFARVGDDKMDLIVEKVSNFDVRVNDYKNKRKSASPIACSSDIVDKSTSNLHSSIHSARSIFRTDSLESNSHDEYQLKEDERCELDSSNLGMYVSSTETLITNTVRCPSPDGTHLVVTCMASPVSITASPETQLHVAKPAEPMPRRARKSSTDSNTSASSCACNGMGKVDWRNKLSALRNAETVVRDRERDLDERERELLKREKRVLAMEQDARQQLIRAQIYLRQAKPKTSNIVNTSGDCVEPFVSPASVYRYSTWIEPGAPVYRCRARSETSVDAGDSTVVLTAAAPQFTNQENPFLQMRALSRDHARDACVTLHNNTVTLARDTRVATPDLTPIAVEEELMHRRPSIPVQCRKDQHDAECKSNTLEYPRPRKSSADTVNNSLTGQSDESTFKKQLKVRSNNIFFSFRSANKTAKPDAKDKPLKTTSFRLPLLPSRKSLKKPLHRVSKDDKENVAPCLNEPKNVPRKAMRAPCPEPKLHIYAI